MASFKQNLHSMPSPAQKAGSSLLRLKRERRRQREHCLCAAMPDPQKDACTELPRRIAWLGSQESDTLIMFPKSSFSLLNALFHRSGVL